MFSEGLHSVSQGLALLSNLDGLPKPMAELAVQPINGSSLTFNELREASDDNGRALLTQVYDPHSGSFLTAHPAGTTELKDDAFSTSLRLRLGLDQIPAGYKCTTHNVEFDCEGRHALSCQNFQGAVHTRHDLIRDELFSTCVVLDRNCETSYHFSYEGDPNDAEADLPRLEQHATGRSIPGDIALRLQRDSGVRTFYDITVINSLTDTAISTINENANLEEGLQKVLNGAFNKKVLKHGADVSKAGGRFVPLVVSVTGVWHQESLRELHKLAEFAATRQGKSETEAWKLLLARLGCSLAKGNECVLKSTRNALQTESASDMTVLRT